MAPDGNLARQRHQLPDLGRCHRRHHYSGKNGVREIFAEDACAWESLCAAADPLTWVVFAVTDLHQLGVYFGRLFPLIGGAGIAVNEQDIIKYLRDYSLYFIAGISLCIPAMPRFWKKHRNHPLVLFLLALIFWMSVYYQSNSAGNPFMYLKF